MSVNRPLDVPQLVKKYRDRYSELDRDLLRKIIRSENKITNPSELKKLDRYLRKAFENKVELSTSEDLVIDWEKFENEAKRASLSKVIEENFQPEPETKKYLKRMKKLLSSKKPAPTNIL